MADVPAEAIDALARTLYDYEDTDDDEVTWEEYRPDAKDMLDVLAPILAAQVRRDTAEQIAGALAGTPKPEEAYWRAWAARLAREIGEARG